MQRTCFRVTFIKRQHDMKRDWKEIPRDGKRAQWTGIYVTINRLGTIVMNRGAYERMDEPAAFLLWFDAPNNTIGLKPAAVSTKNAYPALRSGRHGGRKIFAHRILTECSLLIKDTLEFSDAEIDPDGILLLNLRTAQASKRALNHPTRRTREKSGPHGPLDKSPSEERH
jgi:hypothetical protein